MNRVALGLDPPRPKRICGFDLENRPLAYWYDGQTTSQITAFAWKWIGEEKVACWMLEADGFYRNGRIKLDAQAMFLKFSETLASADLVFGHNIRGHDLPMFNAHLMRYQLPVCPSVLTQDTWKDLPKRAGMSVSLENLAALYGLGEGKLKLSQADWERANRLESEGVNDAALRVVSDVLLQEELLAKLEELKLLKPPRMWRA